MRLDIIAAETRATIADLNRVIAEKGAEVFVFKAELRERVDGELARIPVALAAVKNGEDADPSVVAEIAAKRVSDDLSAMIRGEVEAIGADIKEMSEGFDARVDARLSERSLDVPALVASALDEAIVSRGVIGTLDVHKMLSGEIAKMPSQLTEEQIRIIATEEAVRLVDAYELIARPVVLSIIDETFEARGFIDAVGVRKIMSDEITSLSNQIDESAIRSIATEEAERAVKAAIPDLPDVVPLVDNAVAAAFVTLPVPQNGKSVDPAEVRRMVADAVAGLPAPLTTEDVQGIAVAEAAKAIDLISWPISLSVDDARAVAREEADRAVACAPKGIGVEDVRAIAVEIATEEAIKAIEALPAPEHGRTPTEDEIVPIVESVVHRIAAAEVDRAVSELPKATDGHTPTEDEITPIVERVVLRAVPTEVDRVVSALPPAKPGVGIKRSMIDRDGNLILIFDDDSVSEPGRVVGKDVDMTEIREIVRSELGNRDVEHAKSQGSPISSHLSAMIDAAHRTLSEPLIVRSDGLNSGPPITLNVAGTAEAPSKPMQKTLHTRRDENGELVFDVVEREIPSKKTVHTKRDESGNLIFDVVESAT